MYEADVKLFTNLLITSITTRNLWIRLKLKQNVNYSKSSSNIKSKLQCTVEQPLTS